MKLKFHLFSPQPDCAHCKHKKSISASGPDDNVQTVDYCYIISSRVNLNDNCSFYQLKRKPKTNETKDKTILPAKSNDSSASDGVGE